MTNLPPFNSEPAPEWQGLTLREMQMRRTLVQARMEIQKYKLATQVDAVRQRGAILGGGKSLFSLMTSSFTIAEYAFFAVKAYKLVAPLFRRRKS